MSATLLAGVARRTISPPKGIYLIGYGDRLWGNRGLHDHLTATALTLDDGQTRATVVACDLLAINEHTVARVQAEVGENVLICCSHTHSGPIVYADRHSPRRNRRYVHFLVTQLVEVIRDSQANLQPVSLAWGAGQAHISLNRRERKPDGSIEIGVNPTGKIDPSLGVVQVKTHTGPPLAHLVNFACHNVVLGPKNLLVSADWAGAMRRRVEAETGVPLLFIQGTTGDLNPNHAWGEDDWEAVERLGGQVADQVTKTLDHLTPFQAAPVIFASTDVWLPLEAVAQTRESPPTYRDVLSEIAKLPPFLVDPILNRRYPWKSTLEARGGVWSIPMKLNLLKAGEWALVALGMEVFNEIGLAIKASSPVLHTMVASVSNGCIGYLPTAAEHALGGYEVDIAPYFYRLPGRLTSECEAITLDSVQNLLALS
ncbi:MAG: neutral/alkaline non-lysosomal ceramidase N-terminal domain-containing protein [Chloroflexota bacterium]